MDEHDRRAAEAELESLRAELESLRRQYPDRDAVPPAAVAEPKRCPLCGGTMLPGTARVGSSFWGLLLMGSSSRHLWFRKLATQPQKENVVIGSGEQVGGWQCDRCEATLVRPSRCRWMAH